MKTGCAGGTLANGGVPSGPYPANDGAALEWEAVLIERAGKRFPINGVNLVRIRDGKFTRVRAYHDPTKFPQPAPR